MATVETTKKLATATFYIISGNYDSLISYETSVDLGLVPEINFVSSNNDHGSNNVQN